MSPESPEEGASPKVEPFAHILIVDDEASVRSALRRSLRKEPYRISLAESGAEALQILRNDRPDVMVTDHLMPQMTGLELLRRARLMFPDVARIILTGQAEMETVVAAINEGEIYRFLRKPWDDTELWVADVAPDGTLSSHSKVGVPGCNLMAGSLR